MKDLVNTRFPIVTYEICRTLLRELIQLLLRQRYLVGSTGGPPTSFGRTVGFNSVKYVIVTPKG